MTRPIRNPFGDFEQMVPDWQRRSMWEQHLDMWRFELQRELERTVRAAASALLHGVRPVAAVGRIGQLKRELAVLAMLERCALILDEDHGDAW